VTSSILSNPLFIQSFEAVWSQLVTASLNKHRNRRTNHLLSFHYVLSIWYDMDCLENTASYSSSVVACVFITVGMCIPSHCLATARGGGGGGGQTGSRMKKKTTIFFL
jgi:hypothetical protein